MRKILALCAIVATMIASLPSLSRGEEHVGYENLTQAELIKKRNAFSDKRIKITGAFRQGLASDFFCEIRDTGINTKDYYCFTMGTPSLVRFYLKKDHEQVEALRNVKKGTILTVYGVFNFYGSDFNYVVVDEFSLSPSG